MKTILGGIIKHISYQVWMCVSFDLLVRLGRVWYHLIEISHIYVPSTNKFYASVQSGYKTWSNLGLYVFKILDFWQISQNSFGFVVISKSLVKFVCSIISESLGNIKCLCGFNRCSSSRSIRLYVYFE